MTEIKKDILFSIGKQGVLKGNIFVKQLSSSNFTAMVTFDYPENFNPRLKELLDCAQHPQKGSSMDEAMQKAYESTKILLKRSAKEFE